MAERDRRWLRWAGLTLALALVLGWGLLRLVSEPGRPLVHNLDRAGIVLGYGLACLAAAAGLLGLARQRALRSTLRRWLAGVFPGPHFAGLGEPVPLAGTVEALVVPISRREQPAWLLHHLRPRRVSLVYSNTNQSREAARRLEREFGDRVRFEPPFAELDRTGRFLDDAWDVREAKAHAGERLAHLRTLGVPREATFVDTTGGTVPMSLGLFQAAEEAGASTLYLRGLVRKNEAGPAIFVEDPTRVEDGELVFVSDRRGLQETAG